MHFGELVIFDLCIRYKTLSQWYCSSAPPIKKAACRAGHCLCCRAPVVGDVCGRDQRSKQFSNLPPQSVRVERGSNTCWIMKSFKRPIAVPLGVLFQTAGPKATYECLWRCQGQKADASIFSKGKHNLHLVTWSFFESVPSPNAAPWGTCCGTFFETRLLALEISLLTDLKRFKQLTTLVNRMWTEMVSLDLCFGFEDLGV